MADNPMDMLGNLLSNPEAVSAVGKLLGGMNNQGETSESASEPLQIPDFTAVSDDNGTRLLYALEPYLSSKRKGNLSQIVQAVKIGKMISSMNKRK